MSALPNPFTDSAVVRPAADSAVASISCQGADAAADLIECRFVLDEAAFMAAITEH